MVKAPGDRYTTRPFAVGAFQFVIATAAEDDRVLVQSFFRDLPHPEDSVRQGTVFTLIREDTDARSWAVDGPRLIAQSAPTLDAALKLLVTAVNMCALDAEPEHLHLHAAAATNGGRAVVIAAQRDTGKTTTVAHLVARGWGYVTDETVRVSVEATDVTGFPKPLSIKPGGDELGDHFEPWMIPMGEGADGFRFVPVGASGAAVVGGGVPHLVVLLRRPVDGTLIAGPVVHEIHPADAVVALMQETLDAARFGSAAVELARLAAVSHCFEITTGTPAETADTIETLFRLDPVETLDVRVFPPSDAFSPDVVSVAVGDRAVIHDTASGRIFALDAGATRVWTQLGGWSAEDDIDVHGPVIGPFVAHLRALGVLGGPA
jgi:hypothetical protein